jgi:hypothetical protein
MIGTNGQPPCTRSESTKRSTLALGGDWLTRAKLLLPLGRKPKSSSLTWNESLAILVSGCPGIHDTSLDKMKGLEQQCARRSGLCRSASEHLIGTEVHTVASADRSPYLTPWRNFQW